MKKILSLFLVLVAFVVFLPAGLSQASPPFQWPEQYRMEVRSAFRLPDGKTDKVSSRVFVDGKKERTEMAGVGGKRITIVRRDKNVLYEIDPAGKTYIEFPLPPERPAPQQKKAPFPWKEVGEEEVDGKLCKKFEAVTPSPLPPKDGKAPPPFKITCWVDKETGWLVRDASPGRKSYFSNVQEGPQAAELFEVPEGYRKKDAGGPGLYDPKALAGYKTLNEKLGEPVVDFTLPDADGEEHSLKDYVAQGRPVVLEWINYECPYVKNFYESGEMQKLQKEYTDKGVSWLAICSSGPGKPGHYPPAKIKELNQKYRNNATAYLIDEKGTVGRAHQIYKTPQVVIVNWGKLIYNGAIDNNALGGRSKDEIKNFIRVTLDKVLEGQLPGVFLYAPYGSNVPYAEVKEKVAEQKTTPELQKPAPAQEASPTKPGFFEKAKDWWKKLWTPVKFR